jgi:vinculin
LFFALLLLSWFWLRTSAFQIRKLCRDCKKVLDYLAISEVIETMEDLVQFVKDLVQTLDEINTDQKA